MYPNNSKVLSVEEYMSTEKREMREAKIVPPDLDDNNCFGGIEVVFRNPKYHPKL